MKILLLSPQDVLPANDGGKKAIFYSAKSLASNSEVHLVFFHNGLKDEKCLKDKYLEYNIYAHPFILNTKDSLWNVIFNIFSKTPFKMKKYYNAKILQNIIEIVKKNNIDTILVNHSHLAAYALAVKEIMPIKIILREHNIEFELVRQYSKFEKNHLKKAVAYWQFLKTQKYEISIWSKFDKVFFISDIDFNTAIKKSSNNRFAVLYDGMNSPECEFGLIKKEEKSFIITGSVKSSLQNQLSLKFFINDIWQKFSFKNKGFKLYLTGTKSDVLESLIGFNSEQLSCMNIFNLGFVDNIEEAIASKKYFLSPTYIGSGYRVKIVEAISLKSLVVCSAIDELSIKFYKDSDTIVSYINLSDFENKILEIETNNDIYEKIRNRAFDNISKELTWSKHAKIILDSLK